MGDIAQVMEVEQQSFPNVWPADADPVRTLAVQEAVYESAATGVSWVYSPVLAVPRDIRSPNLQEP